MHQSLLKKTLCLELAALAGAAGLFVACSGGEPTSPREEAAEPEPTLPDETCDEPDIATPTRLRPCSEGSGSFGRWTLDRFGLPAYDYTIDQATNTRAIYKDTEGVERRDHLAAFGNARVNAFLSNDGFVEVTEQDRGVSYIAKVDVARRAYGGGFSYVDDGAATWSTAYSLRPRAAKTTRRFGSSYVETTTTYRELHVAHRTYAPHGDAMAVIDEVTIENLGDDRRTIRHYEYWDVARRPIEIDWTVSGRLPGFAQKARERRDARNGLFTEKVVLEKGILGLRRTHVSDPPRPPREAPSATNHYPADPFVAALEGDISDVYTDDAAFFGQGEGSSPAAVTGRAAGEGAADGEKGQSASGLGQPRQLVVRSDFSLAKGEKKVLRFVYGATAMGAPFVVAPEWRDSAQVGLAKSTEALRPNLMSFASTRSKPLHRELVWHSAQLEASVGYREYWGKHVVPQGSAYLYLHGADGALRDTALFAMPLAYTHPELAKEELELCMGLAFGEGSRFSYAFQGHGMLDDALGIHSAPSDLDLFFLLAMVEYLGATGDMAFLDETTSYYPASAQNQATAFEHMKRAVRHLVDAVGLGEHGLVRVGTGDWSDGIVFEAADRELAKTKGESVPNSQMALWVLPLVGELVAARDPAVATEIGAYVTKLRDAVKRTRGAEFFGRAYFGDGALVRADRIDLEAQVWPLVSRDLLTADERRTLTAAIARDLGQGSKIGTPLQKGGQAWPAIGQLLTWGYTRVDDTLAYDELVHQSLAARAKAFPDLWHGIWSGPDGTEVTTGRTWSSVVTPMTDFPTANNNVHAMAMLGALRVAGIEPTARGLRIEPHVPGRTFSFDTKVIALTQDGTTLEGRYSPGPGRERVLTFVPRAGERIVEATLNGTPVPIASEKPGEALDVLVKMPADTASRGVTFRVVSR